MSKKMAFFLHLFFLHFNKSLLIIKFIYFFLIGASILTGVLLNRDIANPQSSRALIKVRPANEERSDFLCLDHRFMHPTIGRAAELKKIPSALFFILSKKERRDQFQARQSKAKQSTRFFVPALSHSVVVRLRR